MSSDATTFVLGAGPDWHVIVAVIAVLVLGWVFVGATITALFKSPGVPRLHTAPKDRASLCLALEKIRITGRDRRQFNEKPFTPVRREHDE